MRRKRYSGNPPDVPPKVRAYIDLWLFIDKGMPKLTTDNRKRAVKALKKLNETGRAFVEAINEAVDALHAIGRTPKAGRVPKNDSCSPKWKEANSITGDVLQGRVVVQGEHFDAFAGPLRQVATALGLDWNPTPFGIVDHLFRASKSLSERLVSVYHTGFLPTEIKGSTVSPSCAIGYEQPDPAGPWIKRTGRGHRLNGAIQSLHPIALAAVQSEYDEFETATGALLANTIEDRAKENRWPVPYWEDCDGEVGVAHEDLVKACDKAISWARSCFKPPA